MTKKSNNLKYGIAGAILVVIIIVILALLLKGGGQDLMNVVKVGDYVDYQVPAGKNITITSEKSGVSSIQEFEATGNEKWRVFSVEGDNIELISAEGILTKGGLEYATNGVVGLLNYADTLNEIAKIYKTDFAENVRELTIEDVYGFVGWKNIADYLGVADEDDHEAIYAKVNSRYGSFGTRTNARNIYYPTLEGGNENGYKEQTEFEIKSDFKVKNNDSMRSTSSMHKNLSIYGKNDLMEEMLGGSAALASTFVDYDPTNLNNSFLAQPVDVSVVWGVYHLCNALDEASICARTYAWNVPMDNYAYKNAGSMAAIRPVVTLKAGVKTSAGDGSAEKPYTLVK